MHIHEIPPDKSNERTVKSNAGVSTPQSPKIGPAQRQLDVFVGKWNVEGRNAPIAPNGASTNVTGVESYEWLPGGFFLICRWDRDFDDGTSHKGIGLIGFDASSGTYSSHNFGNLGFHREYQLSVRDRTWTFSGKWERATVQFGDGDKTMTVRWEVSKDSRQWKPLCDLKATKIGPTA
jgi:hypothetical protein